MVATEEYLAALFQLDSHGGLRGLLRSHGHLACRACVFGRLLVVLLLCEGGKYHRGKGENRGAANDHLIHRNYLHWARSIGLHITSITGHW